MINYRENTAGLIMPDSAPAHRTESRLLYRLVKRTFDITASATAMLLLAVPMVITAAVIRLDSEGSALFRQFRVGRDGKLFCMYKFRTMVITAPSETPTGELETPYSYITRVGAFLRRTSIDELPQLINVLKGDMSIVGPRPLIAGEADIHSRRGRAGVYDVRPGITGWAQVNGRDNVSAEEKVRLDSEYVERRSVLFDLAVLLDSVIVVLRRDGYVEGAQDRKHTPAIK